MNPHMPERRSVEYSTAPSTGDGVVTRRVAMQMMAAYFGLVGCMEKANAPGVHTPESTAVTEPYLLPNNAIDLGITTPNEKPIGFIADSGTIALCVGTQEYVILECVINGQVHNLDDTVLGYKIRDILADITVDGTTMIIGSNPNLGVTEVCLDSIQSAVSTVDDAPMHSEKSARCLSEITYRVQLNLSGQAAYYVAPNPPPLEGSLGLVVEEPKKVATLVAKNVE